MVMKRNLALLYLIGGSVLILILLGWLLMQHNFSSVPYNQGPLGNLKEALNRVGDLPKLTQREARDEVLAAVIHTNDSSLCEKMRGVSLDGYDYSVVCKNNIAYNQAISSKDPRFCSGVDNSLMSMKDCEMAVINEAVKSGDVRSCDLFTDQEGHITCTSAFAVREALKTGDASECRALSGDTLPNCEVGAAFAKLLRSPRSVQCITQKNGVPVSDCKMAKSLFPEGVKKVEDCGLFYSDGLRNFCHKIF